MRLPRWPFTTGALSLEQVTSIAEWMTENPNGVAIPEEILLGDFDDNGVVDLADSRLWRTTSTARVAFLKAISISMGKST